MTLLVVPISFTEACAYVAEFHRHLRPPIGYKFCVAVADGQQVHGVAIAGRPVSRYLDDTWTVEVTRCATDGTKNVPSMLYGACRRAAFALGYRRVVTYTLIEEPGTSLRAAGFRCIGTAGGGSWNRASRPRVDLGPTQTKLRWEA